MSSRKRALTELSQPQLTPSRYAPSTPHAIRAIQQRSGAKTRSARSIRHVSADAIQPESIRGVLRRFAKISAPVTKKRIVSPSNIHANKENQAPDEGHEEDSLLLNKPNLTFAIEESIEEDDSDLPIAPTPSVLPDDEFDQSNLTFPNVAFVPLNKPGSERVSKRRSRLSLLQSEPIQAGDQEEQDADITIMTERGRRAISEEFTGRLSRYSFGSIRMSDFGTELEIQREPDGRQKLPQLDLDDYAPGAGDESINGGDTEDIRRIIGSPSVEDDSGVVASPAFGNETFRLELPEDDDVDEVDVQGAYTNAVTGEGVVHAESIGIDRHMHASEQDLIDDPVNADGSTSRRQTLLEAATTHSHTSRRKRIKLTRHGTTVPSLPSSLIRRIVLDSYEKQSKRKPKLGRDHIKSLEQATEWFFEQVGEDLAAYSTHGRRKKRVDTDDALLLIKRQRVLMENDELRKLAKSWLPKDVLNELDLPDAI